MKDFRGVIIEESLERKDVLKKVKIVKTQVERVTEKHQTPWIEEWKRKEKYFIRNRKGMKMAVLVETPSNEAPLCIIMHGLGGFKEQPHLETFALAFKESGFTVVRFDTTNTFGESEGNYEDATTTNYYEDLEDVIKWTKTQSWYEEPFWLVGHSLGALSIILFAEKYPEMVRALAPISTVVSGKLSMQAPRYRNNEILKQWRKNGWREEKSEFRPGVIKKLPWSHMEDRLKYDVLRDVKALTMPILLIVGDKDSSTPPKHQQILFDHLPGKKEMHLIKGADHNFRAANYLAELGKIVRDWIKEIQKVQKNTFFIIIRGPLGVGKSTIAIKLAQILNADHVPIDRVLDEHSLTKDKENGYISQKSFITANEIITPKAKIKLQSGVPVIFDGNFYWRSQIDDLIKKLDSPHIIFTLKAPLKVCIERDRQRDKTHGEDAARAVYKKATEFDYGIVIDASKSLKKAIQIIISYLPP